MNIFPSDSDIDEVIRLFKEHSVSINRINRLLGKNLKKHSEYIVRELEAESLGYSDKVKLLIYCKGIRFFSGSDDDICNLRHHLLKKLSDEKLQKLWNIHGVSQKSIKKPSYMKRPLAEKPWHNGGRWAQDFVTALGFPLIFAGLKKGTEKVMTIEDIEPKKTIPQLKDFQEYLKKKMLKILNKDAQKTRCIVTLPTGGGKTRVAVEAFIDWMQPKFDNGQYLIWIAQSEELCEQAISCIKQMWESREFTESLRIYRYFRGRDLNDHNELEGGVVVASIHQLYKRTRSQDPALEIILKDTGAMIIDEAHRAETKMYDVLLEKAEKICGVDLFSICGLTATPGRAGNHKEQETKKLVNRFEVNLIKPDLPEEYQTDPLEYFRKYKYLAKAHHIVYRSGIECQLEDSDFQDENINNDFSDKFRSTLAMDKKRNLLIIKKLLELPDDTRALVYCCTVEHAKILSSIITKQGKEAGFIDSDTPTNIRRRLIDLFRQEKLNFLFNFGVLTTGFDAPKVSHIIICRPIRSEILYEQIVGRGLRGSAFGGTDDCTVIDFSDNVTYMGKPKSYVRFEGFWTDEEERDC